jgi:hypothetical protein
VTREATPDLLGEPFRVDSIVEAPAPRGGEGVWHQYVIVQGTNRIDGLRAGTRSEVSLHVEGVVAHLNERFRKGKAGAADGYRGSKPAPASVGGASADPAPTLDAVREDID